MGIICLNRTSVCMYSRTIHYRILLVWGVLCIGIMYVCIVFLIVYFWSDTYIYIIHTYDVCMVKRHTTLSIDNDLLTQAKERELNVSKLAEEAIKEALGLTDVVIEEPSKCDFCNKEMERATSINLNGLTWLYPDERWICSRCLKVKCDSIPASKA